MVGRKPGGDGSRQESGGFRFSTSKAILPPTFPRLPGSGLDVSSRGESLL